MTRSLPKREAMAALNLNIIFTFVLAACIINSITAPPAKSIWNTDSSLSVDSRTDEDNNDIWDEGNAFDLDDDSSLDSPRGLSQKGWFDDDLTSHLEDIDDANEDDNPFDDSDESVESDEGDPEEELVIEGIDEEDHTGSDKAGSTKDLVDDTMKLRHGGHGRFEDDDSDEDDELPDVGNLQNLDQLPDDTKQSDVLLGGTYNMVSYSNGDDESDENELDDDIDDDDDDESNEGGDDESNSVFSDPDDKEQKIFEDRVLMF